MKKLASELTPSPSESQPLLADSRRPGNTPLGTPAKTAKRQQPIAQAADTV